jgi:hypothetical protein
VWASLGGEEGSHLVKLRLSPETQRSVVLLVMDLGNCRLVEEFTETESGRKQRFIRTPLKGRTIVGGYTKGA